jgi:hypothetical protein
VSLTGLPYRVSDRGNPSNSSHVDSLFAAPSG